MILEENIAMSKQIRGIILEGQSCSGKTSIFNAIKQCHSSESDFERNAIYLSEHYSQTLNSINGSLKNLSQEENMKVLSDRVSMLEQLSSYANSMGSIRVVQEGCFSFLRGFT